MKIGEESAVPGRRTCIHLSRLRSAASIPVDPGYVLVRAASYPKRGQLPCGGGEGTLMSKSVVGEELPPVLHPARSSEAIAIRRARISDDGTHEPRDGFRSG